MRRKEKEITDIKEIESVIQKTEICHVAMVDGNRPYVVPMCFGYEAGVLFLHSAKAGRKIDILQKNANVCVELETDGVLVKNEKACRFSMRYSSVVAFGRVRFIDDPDVKRHALDIIMRHYADGPFSYSDEALERMMILRVDIENMTGKRSG